MSKKKFIIITGNSSIGSNEKGYYLYTFLNIFVPKKDILLISHSEINQYKRLRTTYCFLFFPTSVKPKTVQTILFDHLICCEFYDYDDIFFKNILDFTQLSKCLLKLSINTKINFPFKHVGCLPVPLKPAPYPFINIFKKKKYDVSFAGINTFYTYKNYFQRIEWLQEILLDGSLNFTGGLIETPRYQIKKEKELPKEVIEKIKTKSRSRLHYLNTMAMSHISLCPAGHERWTYRHYEAILTETILVSNNIKNLKLLCPLPTENIVIIDDHTPVVPTLKNILSHLPDWRDKIKENKAFLKKYLHNGSYSKKKTKLFHQFMEQLPQN